MDYYTDSGAPLVWCCIPRHPEFRGLMLGRVPIYFDDDLLWVSYVVLPQC